MNPCGRFVRLEDFTVSYFAFVIKEIIFQLDFLSYFGLFWFLSVIHVAKVFCSTCGVGSIDLCNHLYRVIFLSFGPCFSIFGNLVNIDELLHFTEFVVFDVVDVIQMFPRSSFHNSCVNSISIPCSCCDLRGNKQIQISFVHSFGLPI